MRQERHAGLILLLDLVRLVTHAGQHLGKRRVCGLLSVDLADHLVAEGAVPGLSLGAGLVGRVAGLCGSRGAVLGLLLLFRQPDILGDGKGAVRHRVLLLLQRSLPGLDRLGERLDPALHLLTGRAPHHLSRDRLLQHLDLGLLRRDLLSGGLYRAPGLLLESRGLSVRLDGVLVEQPFGDGQILDRSVDRALSGSPR